jgi:hypothetical protein
MMYDKIKKRYEEFQIELDILHKQIELNSDHCRKYLASQLKIKVGCVLTEQLGKDEIVGSVINKARDEFIRLQDLFHGLNSQPLISVLSIDDNQTGLNAPRVVFPSIAVDGFGWNEVFSTENTLEVMEHSDQQQISNNINTTYRKTNGMLINLNIHFEFFLTKN